MEVKAGNATLKVAVIGRIMPLETPKVPMS